MGINVPKMKLTRRRSRFGEGDEAANSKQHSAFNHMRKFASSLLMDIKLNFDANFTSAAESHTLNSHVCDGALTPRDFRLKYLQEYDWTLLIRWAPRS